MTKTYELPNEKMIMADVDEKHHTATVSVYALDDLVEAVNKTAHWVYKIYGGFHEQGDWYCSKCDYPFNYGYGHAEYCPKCGCEMSETPTEEVIGDRDYDWVTRR